MDGVHADPNTEPRTLVARIWSSSAARFLVVGGFSVLFDIGLLWMLHEGFGLPLTISTPAAFLASFVLTYTLQRTVAFRSSEGVAPSAVRYTILVAVNTVATTLIVAASAAIGLPWAVGKVFAVVATTVWNYFAYRFWVFATPKSAG